MKKTMKTRLVLGIASAATAVLLSTPAFALFTNGGFETGDLTGWTVGGAGIAAVIDSTGTMSGQTLDIDPYNGSYMARINNIWGGYDTTTLSQTDTISQADIDNGSTLYVNWGAALIEPSNTHPQGSQPYFSIDVSVNGSSYAYYSADALAHGTDPTWVNAGSSGGTLWYKTGQYSLDLSTLSLGDSVAVSLSASDCGWGGHGGYAFLDGIGTVKPPTTIPEPGTMLLLGTGLAGLVVARRRKAIKKS